MSETELPQFQGGCQCGRVRYVLLEPPSAIYVCHCRDCQKQSASAFGVSVLVPTGSLRILQGAPRVWSMTAGSGALKDCHLCPDCGTRLWHVSQAEPGIASVKGGSLDVPPDLSEVDHIWVSRRLPGILIPPRARRFDEEPPRPPG